MKIEMKKVLVIAPHPDDETLGVGGTIKRLTSNGVKVSVLVVAGHTPPNYSEKSYQKTIGESLKAFKVLGVDEYKFLNYPATMLNEIPTVKLNDSIYKFLLKMREILPNKKTIGLFVKQEEAINIDSKLDYELAKVIAKKFK